MLAFYYTQVRLMCRGVVAWVSWARNKIANKNLIDYVVRSEIVRCSLRMRDAMNILMRGCQSRRPFSATDLKLGGRAWEKKWRFSRNLVCPNERKKKCASNSEEPTHPLPDLGLRSAKVGKRKRERALNE